MRRFLVEQFTPARLAADARKLDKQLAAAHQHAGGDKAFVEAQLQQVGTLGAVPGIASVDLSGGMPCHSTHGPALVSS